MEWVCTLKENANAREREGYNTRSLTNTHTHTHIVNTVGNLNKSFSCNGISPWLQAYVFHSVSHFNSEILILGNSCFVCCASLRIIRCLFDVIRFPFWMCCCYLPSQNVIKCKFHPWLISKHWIKTFSRWIFSMENTFFFKSDFYLDCLVDT